MEIWNEPVRGDYPDVGILGLPGADRITGASRRYFPRPPIHHLTGFTPVGDGVFEQPPTGWLVSGTGLYPGGLLAYVADAPMGSITLPQLPPGAFVTTSELSVNFLRPASPASGTLRAEPSVIQVGRNLALSQASITDASGRMLGHATTRCVILRVDPPPPPIPDGYRLEPVTYDGPDPWQRPVPGGPFPAEMLSSMSGLEIMQAGIAGELEQPPIATLLATSLTGAAEGEATFTTILNPWMHSPARSIYGGITALLADNALNGAVFSIMPKGHSFASLDLKVNYLRPIFGDGSLLRARAQVVHRGRTIAVARAELLNAEDKPIALATGSALILPDRPWNTAQPVVADDVPQADTE